MLSQSAIAHIRKVVDDIKQRRTALFTAEIQSSRTYARLFPRAKLLINDNEKTIIEYLDRFEALCMEIFSYRYGCDNKCANDFILELENLLLRIEELIKVIDWTK